MYIPQNGETEPKLQWKARETFTFSRGFHLISELIIRKGCASLSKCSILSDTRAIFVYKYISRFWIHFSSFIFLGNRWSSLVKRECYALLFALMFTTMSTDQPHCNDHKPKKITLIRNRYSKFVLTPNTVLLRFCDLQILQKPLGIVET